MKKPDWYDVALGRTPRQPTHWMPLPEPPQARAAIKAAAEEG